MGVVDLLVVSCMPVLKLLLVSAVGSLLAIDPINLLGQDARKHLNNVVYYVFTPALIEAKLAETVTLDSMLTLWFMPLNILFTFIVGSALGWIIIRITAAPSHLRGLIVGCCSAGNLGNLPLIIIPAICKENGSPFGDPDRCHTYGMAYVALSMSISTVYIWLYAYNVMLAYSEKHNGSTSHISIHHSGYSSGGTATLFPDSCNEALLVHQKSSTTTDFQDQLATPYVMSIDIVKVPVFANIKSNLKRLGEKVNFKRIFTPSTIGAIVGFFAGIVPQIRHALIGTNAPLRVIQDSASLLSDGCVPLLTLILGGNLVKGGIKGSGIKASVIIWIIVARYVVLPLSGVFIVKAANHFGLIQLDPLYQFILLLQYAVPPAMSIGVITQLFEEGETECSFIMLWTYLIAPLTLTLWCTAFMWLVA